MSETNTVVALPPKFDQVAKKLNGQVLSVIGSDKIIGFEKAYLVAFATGELKQALTAEYMKPIMELQGSRIGFKTDKDREGGYLMDVVKTCLIEAVLMGVQPVGNQFNIIAGNCYITKEGFGYLLDNYKGLSYKIVPELPRINPEKTSAAIVMSITWTLNGGVENKEKMDIPIRVNSSMGTDAVIGKATRKARCWLFNTIAGTDITDGDVQDVPHTVIEADPTAKQTAKEKTAKMKADAKAEAIAELKAKIEMAEPGSDQLEALTAELEELENAG